jgi:hypothetical protein
VWGVTELLVEPMPQWGTFEVTSAQRNSSERHNCLRPP